MKSKIYVLIAFLALFGGRAFSQCGDVDMGLLPNEGWEIEPFKDPDGCCYLFEVLSQESFPWGFCVVNSEAIDGDNMTINSGDSYNFEICFDLDKDYVVIVDYYDSTGVCLGRQKTTIIVEEGCFCDFQLCWSVNGDGPSMQGIEEIVGIKVRDADGVDHTVPFLVPPLDISAGFLTIMDALQDVLMASPFDLDSTYVGTDSTGCYKLYSMVPGYSVSADFESLAFYGFDDSGLPVTIYFTSSCPCIVEPPTTLKCALDVKDGTQVLSWEPVPNATSYEIEQIFNDPTCCSESIHVSTLISVPRSNSFTSSSFEPDCFSWRVRSVCEDGVKSEWSEKQCSCDIPIDGDIGPGRAKMNPDESGEINTESFEIKILPNPANDYVTITLEYMQEVQDVNTPELVQPELIIYDIESRIVKRLAIGANEAIVTDLSDLKSGIYIVKINDGGVTLSTEKLVLQ